MPPRWRYSGPLGETRATFSFRSNAIGCRIRSRFSRSGFPQDQAIGFDLGGFKWNSVAGGLINSMRNAPFSMEPECTNDSLIRQITGGDGPLVWLVARASRQASRPCVDGRVRTGQTPVPLRPGRAD